MPNDSRRIHLIERDDHFVPLGNSVYESGFWKLTEEKAELLKDGMIYFHKAQDEPSFYGGRIIDYRIFPPKAAKYYKMIKIPMDDAGQGRL